MDVEREISTSFAIVRIRDQSEENLQLLLGKLKIIPIFLPFSDTFAGQKEPRISLPGQSFLGADVQTFVESPALPKYFNSPSDNSRIPTPRILSL